MGLDITYYRRASLPSEAQQALLAALPEDDRYDAADEAGIHHVEPNPDFPGREAGLPDSEWVVAERAGGFPAGSYSGYGRWRDSLAKLVGWRRGSAGPFNELINFADNEGVIGPVVSAKLAKDFSDWQERAQVFSEKLDGGSYFIGKYSAWRVAFEVAADGGYVHFH